MDLSSLMVKFLQENQPFLRKKIMRFSLFAIFIFSISMIAIMPAYAEMDASTQMLLKMSKNTKSSTSPESGLESGRYKVKGKLPAKQVTVQPIETNAKSLEKAVFVKTEKIKGPAPTAVATTKAVETAIENKDQPVAKNEKPAVVSEMKEAEVKKSEDSKPTEVSAEKKEEAVVKAEEPAVTEPSVVNQVADLVSGQSQPFVEAYKEQVHPDDIRMNTIEVTILPGLVYNDSKSNYYFRNFQSFYPQYALKAEFWFTPLIGMYADYESSMGADVSGASSSRVSAKHESTEIGIDFRKFFGMSRKANSMEFGFHVFDYKFTVPSDETTKTKTKSSGLGLHIKARFPTTPTYAWVVGGKLVPRVSHSEQAAGVNLNSGSGSDSIRIGALVGGEFKLARQNQLVWELSYTLEKNQFSGVSNTVDPEKGVAPTGVTVNNNFVIFSLGYRWGQ